MFWLATLAQAALWIAVPMLFYAAPPGELPQLLAIGHEFQLDGDFGPPLAYWLAEIAFRIAGLFGVYALSQLCRGRDLLVRVRARPRHRRRHARGDGGAAHGRHFLVHGADAGFRPADPRHGAVGGGAVVLLARGDARAPRDTGTRSAPRPRSCSLSSDAALILLGALLLFTALTERGRAALDSARAVDRRWRCWSAGLFVHLLWLERAGVDSDAGA